MGQNQAALAKAMERQTTAMPALPRRVFSDTDVIADEVSPSIRTRAPRRTVAR
ncbi:hypothetical protein [Streptomyces sp. NPDC094049]|uniref:hypothetical protein n=1 Tax=Streptomyces sp. NPDC094049 TaxID=3154987 RepID=UPI003329061E